MGKSRLSHVYHGLIDTTCLFGYGLPDIMDMQGAKVTKTAIGPMTSPVYEYHNTLELLVLL